MAYDVIVIGGALSGASVATLLLRENPALRVLIVEKSPRFGRKVGEATVEVSGYFLCRVLGLDRWLRETQIPKQGLRFWFTNERTTSLADASEIGPRYQVRLPSYQIDRSMLDEEVLRRAREAGAELLRPASVTDVQLTAGGTQRVAVRHGETTETFEARWVVDASGVAALLARREGWWEANLDHPTAAAWGRWTGVKDWDCPTLAAKYPEWARACYGGRNSATNHVVGDGWWSWWIPLQNGDVSIGVVFDQRSVEWPQDGGSLGERLKNFLTQNPIAREMLEDARLVEGDINWRKNLAYRSRTFVGDGFALVGDAAAFMDPLYSPGMDWISFTSVNAVDLIAAQLRGEAVGDKIAKLNRDFVRSYDRWFDAIYRDKYDYIGECDLLRPAFLLDLGLYYLGVVKKPFLEGRKGLMVFPFSHVSSVAAYHVMRTYNRRLAAIGRSRRMRRMLGRANHGRRHMIRGYTLDPKDQLHFFGPLWQWLKLELTEGWRSWGRSRREDSAEPPATSLAPMKPAA